MRNLVVLGVQWGDEGKGKIVDWLCDSYDVVVRFQGGNNAGHTLVIGDNVYKLNLLPSAIVRPEKLSVIGGGVVFDPLAFITEVTAISAMGVSVTPERLKIAGNATLLLPLHQELDLYRETSSSGAKPIAAFGTTRRGIGPAYEDRVGRRALRVCDLLRLDEIDHKIDHLLNNHNALRNAFGLPCIQTKTVRKFLEEVAPKVVPYVTNEWLFLRKYVKEGKKILFEGAQGAMLDVDYGTYPYVTSSNTIAAQAAIGSGLSLDLLSDALGVVKAYTTRVGLGPFPTELNSALGDALREKGSEFGTVTGRVRRCGWFDAVAVRHALEISGVKKIALTKLDVLDGFDTLKICCGYELNGKKTDVFPMAAEDQFDLKPIYKDVKGWQEKTAGIRRWEDLPQSAVDYIRELEALIGAQVVIVSTGPERDSSIFVDNIFKD